MIKVIIGYKLKKDANMQPILLKLRSHAMTYPGYVGTENLLSEQDLSIVAMMTTWEKLEDWRSWNTSIAKQEILREAEAIFEEEPRITIYRIIPTVRWV